MSIIRAAFYPPVPGKQLLFREVSAARVVSSGHCTTKRAEREVLPGESEKRFAFFDKWACTIPCGRMPTLSGLLVASYLPQKGRRVFLSCSGFIGLFHVKHARLSLSRARERVPALSGLPWASHLPRRGRQVPPSCRGVAGLFHVKHARLALSCGREKERLPSPACFSQSISSKGEASFRALPWGGRFVTRETEKAAKLSPRRLSCGK